VDIGKNTNFEVNTTINGSVFAFN